MIPLKPNQEVTIRGKKYLEPDQVIQFFREGFAPGERKFKMMLLTEMMTGLRINEVCHLQLTDIQNYNEDSWRVLVNVSKKRDCQIEERIFPALLVGYLKDWVRDNYEWIREKENYIFPHKSNHKHLHTPAHNV